MKVDSKLEAALKGLFIKDGDGQIALRTAAFDDGSVVNASSSQSPRSLENLLLGAIGLDGDGKPVLRLAGAGRLYKVYTALLTQVGTGAPTVKVLENTIGDLVFSYDSIGNYSATLAGAFTADKTTILTAANTVDGNVNFTSAVNDIDGISIRTYYSGSLANDIASDYLLEIRVYS